MTEAKRKKYQFNPEEFVKQGQRTDRARTESYNKIQQKGAQSFWRQNEDLIVGAAETANSISDFILPTSFWKKSATTEDKIMDTIATIPLFKMFKTAKVGKFGKFGKAKAKPKFKPKTKAKKQSLAEKLAKRGTAFGIGAAVFSGLTGDDDGAAIGAMAPQALSGALGSRYGVQAGVKNRPGATSLPAISGTMPGKQLSAISSPTLEIGKLALDSDRGDCGCDDAQQKIRRKQFRTDVVDALESIAEAEEGQQEELEDANKFVQNPPKPETEEPQQSFINKALEGIKKQMSTIDPVEMYSLLGVLGLGSLFLLSDFFESMGGPEGLMNWLMNGVSDQMKSVQKGFRDWYEGQLSPELDRLVNFLNGQMNVVSSVVGTMATTVLGDAGGRIVSKLLQNNVKFTSAGKENTSQGVYTSAEKDETGAYEYTGEGQPWMKMVTSQYGVSRQGGKEGHGGVDFRAKPNDPVTSVGYGYVEKTESGGRGGNVVVVRDPQGRRVLYMHLNKFEVKKGDKVVPGTLLGLAGNTGKPVGGGHYKTHIHLGVKEGRKTIDPLTYINQVKAIRHLYNTDIVDEVNNEISTTENVQKVERTTNIIPAPVVATPPGGTSNEELAKHVDDSINTLSDRIKSAAEPETFTLFATLNRRT